MSRDKNKQYKEVDGNYIPKMKTIARFGLIYSILIMLIGIAITVIYNVNRYDGVVGEPVDAYVAVYGVRQVEVEDEQYGNLVTNIVYKPVGSFTYEGYDCDVLLGEGYSHEEMAWREVGDMRHITIDSATLEEVTISPIHWVGIGIAAIAFVVGFVFMLMLVYFSSNNDSYIGRQYNNYRIYG